MRQILFVLALVSMVGCSKSKNPSPSSSNKAVNGKSLIGGDFNQQQIVGAQYVLLQDLDFSKAQSREMSVFGESKASVKLTLLSYAYQNQQPVEGADVENSCSLVVEVVNGKSPTDLLFKQNDRLKVGDISRGVKKGEIKFSLQLTAQAQSFYLECRGVKNVQEINAHVGHVLSVR